MKNIYNAYSYTCIHAKTKKCPYMPKLCDADECLAWQWERKKDYTLSKEYGWCERLQKRQFVSVLRKISDLADTLPFI